MLGAHAEELKGGDGKTAATALLRLAAEEGQPVWRRFSACEALAHSPTQQAARGMWGVFRSL